MKLTKCFNGANVFLSRNLVAPEIHAAVKDALKDHGAHIFDNCDSSRNGPDDYHVISSYNHVKFDDLKAKGCKLIGPECVISCAKENRSLPKREDFTCCLAMDGVKVIASGFEKDEKAMIEKLVTSMGGVLQNRASLDVNFVMVKNVLAPKYKWALTSLKKPVVTVSWLHQCWKEHRLVPHEPYKVLPFYGLTICVTRLPAVRTKEAKVLLILLKFTLLSDALRLCILDILYAAEGDKYLVARKWGHIHIVAKKWLDQSIAKRSCLEERSFPVQGSAVSLAAKVKSGQKGHHSQDRDSTISPVPCTVMADSETTQSLNMSSTYSDSTSFNKGEGVERPASEPGDEKKLDCSVADDSQSDNDLYLSDCRIILVGFQAAEMRKLVGMVRRGGGSRYMSFSEKLTHIIVGVPTENETKELKRLGALGVIHVVRAIWLEDCDREKKEVPVTQRHTVSDMFFPNDSAWFSNASGTGTTSSDQARSVTVASSMPTTWGATDMAIEDGTSVRRNGEREPLTNIEGGNSVKEAAEFDLLSSLNTGHKDQKRVHPNVAPTATQLRRISNIFRGTVFRFSSSFPEQRRAEIIEWVNQGGGNIVDDHSKKKVQFIIGSHGQKQQASNCAQTTIVSTHWIRSCLEDGSIQDVGSHVIYSPLPCNVPIRGFNEFRICISQYEDKDKLLLRNLCFVLGSKFSEKLTRKATHLICKFTCGKKYIAACEWGIQPVTFDWISECIRQDAIVSADPFRPKDATLLIQSQVTKKLNAEICQDISANNVESMEKGSVTGEIPHIVPDVAAAIEDLLEQSNKIQDMVTSETPRSERNIFSPDRSILVQDRLDSSSSFIPKHWVRIEELVARGSTMKNHRFHGSTVWNCGMLLVNSLVLCGQKKFPCSQLSLGKMKDKVIWSSNMHSAFRSTMDHLMRSCYISVGSEKQDNPSPQKVIKGSYDGFSETQTDSQVVGYEEDLSGIQMIIDKARARSSLT
ncbi:hypothetical protein Sjap_021671 [Stephania japonica]|uniref:BRCT domain-containing protein n=1 Tax=Stephania japonica TaxID=461633 RepID=A0AAP0EW82_9MAGN